jgi:tripartite-type tricarboxylate transporter receptor subunit TctC
MKRRDVLAGFAALSGCALAPRLGAAQAKYPDRAIKLVVPFAPGGVNDAVARLWAEHVKAPLGGTVYIENQGGAGGAVGALVLNPIGMVKPLYDPIKDFEPIAMIAVPALTIAVNPSLPVHTVRELIDYDKANPGKLAYGSAGAGSMTHLAGELFKSLAKTPDIVHVPYKGSGPSLADGVSGHVPMVVANITGQVLELHRTGKLRMVAVTAPDRIVAAPDIPTAVESGLPGMISVNFTGLFAPRGTPKPIVDQIAAATDKVTEDDSFRTMLIDAGMEPYRHSTPGKTAQFLEQDIARWTPVFRSIGLKLN